MEYKELETLWKRYDERLENLEKINKTLLKNTLLQKPQKRLNGLKYQSLYGIIGMPIIVLVALHPNFKLENLDWMFILGCILTFAVVLYLCIMIFRSYLILKNMNLYKDTIIKSLNEIVRLKKISSMLEKSVFIHYPVLCVGIILIAWNSFVLDTKTMVFLIIFFLITYVYNIWARRKYNEKYNQLERDIVELEEYREM